MITVLHGDNTLKSREEFGAYLTGNKGKEGMRLEGAGLTWEAVSAAVRGTSLFGDERVVVIEKLFSLPAALRKKIIDLIIKNDGEVVLWEEKKLTAAQLASLAGAEIKEFRVAKVLFKFLDGIKVGAAKEAIELLHLTLGQEEAELVWAMLERQVRLLILAKSGELDGMAEWQIKRFASAASGFSQQKLVEMYLDLVRNDWRRKTSVATMDLKGILDLYLVEHLS